MIDFHSHVLPGIDDGSRSVEMSIDMLRMEAEQGIDCVVATPHFYADHDRPEQFFANRDRAEDILRSEMEKYPDMPQLHVGAEVYYFHGMSESELLPQLTIRGTSCIMIEMGQSPWREHIYQELQMIYQRWGIVPIIAHVDRYISPLRTHGILEKLSKLPVLVQANAEFFLKRSTAGFASKMIMKDQIHLLGSDCHNTSSRKPNLGEALQVLQNRCGSDAFNRVRNYGADVLQRNK